jgi:hypothetical protein
MGTQSQHTVAVAKEGVAVIEQETRTVHLYVPRPTGDTSDEDLAAKIDAMSRLRREWVDRGYNVKLIQ